MEKKKKILQPVLLLYFILLIFKALQVHLQFALSFLQQIN